MKLQISSIYKNAASILLSQLIVLLAHAQTPVISSFSPQRGIVGSVVTINGTNFSSVAANNIVYFGGVKAQVSSASASGLTVTIPRYARSSPIKVTNLATGLTAYSNRPFLVTFPGGSNTFTDSSFGNAITLTASKSINFAVSGDLDGDGKPDIVGMYGGGGSSAYALFLFRNIGSINNLAFAPPVSMISLPGAGSDGGPRLADINGDGKLDIVVCSNGGISILKNMSSVGNISFAQPVQFVSSSPVLSPSDLDIADLDNDGKPDFVFITGYGNPAYIRNNSSISNFAVDSARILPTSIPSPYNETFYHVRAGDIDGDGRKEICAVNGPGNYLVIYRNLGAPGAIAFAPHTSFYLGFNTSPRWVSIADIDDDDIDDICIVNTYKNEIQIFKNKSKPGEFRLETLQYYPFLPSPSQVECFDLNGDARHDLVVNQNQQVKVIRNDSKPCNSSLGSLISFFTSDLSGSLYADDLNGDGKPELIFTKAGAILQLFENKIPQTIKGCSNGTTSISSNIGGSVYQWQQNSGSGFSNISNGANFIGADQAVLQIINPPLSWNIYKYRCIIGSDTSATFIHNVSSSIVPSVSLTNCPGSVCGGDSSVFTATVTDGGPNPLYQWQDSLSATGWQNINGATAQSLRYATVVTGTKIRCRVSNNFSCASQATVNSPAFVISFICENQVTLCPNASVQLTSNLTGSTYIWQIDSTGEFTGLSSSSTYSGLNTPTLQINNISSSAYGYKYRCMVNLENNKVFVLKFANNWTGAQSSAWENPQNWSCSQLPDANTDVLISSGQVILNSNATVRSLTVSPGATFTINPGFTLTITH